MANPLTKIEENSLNELLSGLKKVFEQSSEAREKEAKIEMERLEENFQHHLGKILNKEFGERYVKNHKSESVTQKDHVCKMLKETMQNRQGYFIAGIPGCGKTHILLEYYFRIMTEEFKAIKDGRGTFNYPLTYPDWFHRHVRYYYSSWISDAIKNKEKPKVSRINLIDDFMVEELQGYVLAGWDSYFEEINRRDGVMIITSNLSPSAIDKPQFKRMVSRIAGSCKIIELPTIDRRQEKEKGVNQ